MQWMSVCPIPSRRLAKWLLLFSYAAFALTPLAASSSQSAPQLEAPTGAVVHVSSESQLQGAVAALTSNTTIVIAPGTYTLSRTLTINGALSNVVIRGATDNSADVVLVGRGMANADYGAVPHGIRAGGGVQNITIANLTVREVYNHAVLFEAGTVSPRIFNVHLVNAGQQFIKATGDSGPVDTGIVEYSLIEATTPSRDVHATGVEIEGGSRWAIRHNVFRNLQAPPGQLAEAAVVAREGAHDTIVEANTFVNTQKEVALGLAQKDPNDHSGGVVRNNFIARKAGLRGGVAVSIGDSPSTQVLHNTILLSGTSDTAIELRFADTTNVVVRNNLLDGEIRMAEGATGTIADNYTNATADMFADAAAGDLHLVAAADAVMDRVGVVPGAPGDWDAEARPQGGAADYGADEYLAAAAQSSSAEPASSGQAPAPSITSLASSGSSTSAMNDSSAASALPAPWQTRDVGNASPAGAASYSNETFTVLGGGPSIGGTADQFRFVYQTMDGDGDIVARVDSLDRTHVWAKAGVMFRDELTDASRHAFAFVGAGKGAGFESRLADGTSSSQTTVSGSGRVPAWMKLTRRGNTFTAYTSDNGTTWAQMGSDTISMNSQVYIGLAVSSRSTRELTTATFSQIAVVLGGSRPDPDPDTPNQPPAVTVISPASGATFTAPATIELSASASDADGSISQVDFYLGGTLVGSDTTSPYTATWNTTSAGTYPVTAAARDNEGGWTTSAAVSINVTAAVSLPRYVVFTPSADHSTNVTSYTVEFFAAGANPASATPVRTQNIGKPTPVNNEIKVDVAATVQALQAGTYFSTVSATGSGGTSRSSPSETFGR